MDSLLHGIAALGQPMMGSVFDETGTPEAHYAESGPYSCCKCVHKTKIDEPFCIHPKVVGDHDLQSRLVFIDGRPTIKIDMEHGCCSYVRQALPTEDHDEDDHGGHE